MSKKKTNNPYWTCIKAVLLRTFQDHTLRWNFLISAIFLMIGIVANIYLPLALKAAIDGLASSSPMTPVTLILFSYGAIWMISQGSYHIRAFFTYQIEQRITSVFGIKLLSHLYTLSHSYFLNQKPGELTNVIRKAQQDIPSLILGIFFHLLPTVVEFFFVILVVSLLYPLIYSFLLSVTLATFCTYTLFSMKRALESRERANEIERNTDGIVTDWLSNHEAIKVFGKQTLAIHTCEEQIKKREMAEVTFMKHFSVVHLGQALILGLGLLSITYCVGQHVRSGELTIGDFILFNGYILQFITPLSILGQVMQNIKKALVDMKGIIDILLTKSDIKEISSPKSLSPKHLKIEFRHVCFTYKTTEILKDMSFTINPGEAVVIIGPTGAGKSTIAKLLLRLYDPTEGQIFINEANLKEVAFQAISQSIGWVPQESYLLNDTLKNNLLFARPDASLRDIESALDLACLSSFIKSLPQGLDTCVGNRGLKLSGGEKQRLSLARLFLKNPKIGIFDEATSFLDRNTELTIQDNLNRYLPEMSKIIITHRPFMVTKADKIISLSKKGRIEKETHHEFKNYGWFDNKQNYPTSTQVTC